MLSLIEPGVKRNWPSCQLAQLNWPSNWPGPNGVGLP